MIDHVEGTFQGYGGLDLYFQRWCPAGRPQRAEMVVVHGLGEHSGRYGNVVNWFVPKGYGVWALDHRGHGRSPGKRGHVNRFAEYTGDVRAFLTFVRAQEPRGPLFLVGHSLGGLIVLNAVLHDPAGLQGVVASAPPLARLPIPAAKVLLARTLSAVSPQFTLANGLELAALSRDPEVVRAYVADPLVHDRVTARFGTEMMAAIDWTHAHAADLALPLFIVHGGADRIAFPEGSRTFFEHLTFLDRERCEYEGYYHEVFNDVGKERVLGDVENWIARRLALS